MLVCEAGKAKSGTRVLERGLAGQPTPSHQQWGLGSAVSSPTGKILVNFGT